MAQIIQFQNRRTAAKRTSKEALRKTKEKPIDPIEESNMEDNYFSAGLLDTLCEHDGSGPLTRIQIEDANGNIYPVKSAHIYDGVITLKAIDDIVVF